MKKILFLLAVLLSFTAHAQTKLVTSTGKLLTVGSGLTVSGSTITGSGGLRAIDTPSMLASMIWDGKTQGAYKMFTQTSDSTLTVIDTVNGQDQYLRVVSNGDILKIKIGPDSTCYQTDGGTATIGFKNWKGAVDKYAIPKTWVDTTCPVPSVGTFYMTSLFNSFDTTGGAGNAAGQNEEQLEADPTSDNSVTTPGTPDYIYVYVPTTLISRLHASAWSFVSGYSFNYMGTLVDSTHATNFPIGIIKLHVTNPVTLSVGHTISIGWTATGIPSMKANNPLFATFSFNGTTPVTGTPRDWSSGSNNKLGQHTKIVMEGH